MSASDDELFSIDDFQSIGVSVYVHNQTTKTGVQDESRLLGEVSVPLDAAQTIVRLMEFSPQAISLDVPQRTGAIGHVIDCTIDVNGVILPFCFKVRCKVTKVTSLEGGRDQMDLQLLEFEQRYFDALQNIFSKRQGEIEEFLNRMKR